MTAELRVRYQASIVTAEELTVRAWLGSSRFVLFELRAEIKKGSSVKALAQGKFIKPNE